eukprot:1179095-Prorocentrum_minimum.AAC.6
MILASRWVFLFFLAASLPHREVAGEGDCAIAFTGPNCEFPANMPCFGKAYTKGYVGDHVLRLRGLHAETSCGFRQYSSLFSSHPSPTRITVWQKDLGDNLRAYHNMSRLMKIMKIGKHPAQSEEEALRRFPPEPLWGLRHNPKANPYRSCAVVGNSPTLKSKKGPFFGAEIDRHDFIMRFNNAPTKVNANMCRRCDERICVGRTSGSMASVQNRMMLFSHGMPHPKLVST